jgi:hypothetical protein
MVSLDSFLFVMGFFLGGVAITYISSTLPHLAVSLNRVVQFHEPLHLTPHQQFFISLLIYLLHLSLLEVSLLPIHFQ